MKTPIKIPHYWTAEQAYIVFELVDTLRDEILKHYEHEMVEYQKKELCVEFEADSKADNNNEELPF